jgi:hypothetical protein
MEYEKSRMFFRLGLVTTILFAATGVAFILWGHYHSAEIHRAGLNMVPFVLILGALTSTLKKRTRPDPRR